MADEDAPKAKAEDESGAAPAGDTSSDPAPDPAPYEGFKDAIVRSLIGGEAPDPSVVGDTPEPVEDAAPAPPKAADTPQKPKPDQKPKASEDDEDDPSFDDLPPKMTKIGAKIDKLRGKLREARESAEYGAKLSRIAMDGGVAPEAMQHWAQLGAAINRGDPAAAAAVAAMLQRAGYTMPATEAAPAAKPPEEPTADAIAEQIYAEEFAKQVEDFLITEDVGRASARRLANRVIAARPKPAAQPMPQTPQAPNPAPSQPRQNDPVAAAALRSVFKLLEDYEVRIPGFRESVYPEVLTAITTKRLKSGVPDPTVWTMEVAEAVREAMSKRATPAPKAKPTSSLRPSSRATAPGKEDDFRTSLVREIMFGQIDD